MTPTHSGRGRGGVRVTSIIRTCLKAVYFGAFRPKCSRNAAALLRPLRTKISRNLLALEVEDFKGCTLGKCEIFIASKRLWIVPQDKKNTLMSKEEWAKFADKFPQYKNYGLPYKVRRALKQKLDKNND